MRKFLNAENGQVSVKQLKEFLLQAKDSDKVSVINADDDFPVSLLEFSLKDGKIIICVQ